MSSRATRRVLFLALLVLVPLPMFTFDALVPVARYLLLGAVCVGMRVAEGPGGVVWQLTALFFGHALVYGAVLWAVAWAVTRSLDALPASARAALVACAIAAGMLWAVAAEPYRTPFGRAERSNLIEVLR
jgi:phosphate/sulfate permease